MVRCSAKLAASLGGLAVAAVLAGGATAVANAVVPAPAESAPTQTTSPAPSAPAQRPAGNVIPELAAALGVPQTTLRGALDDARADVRAHGRAGGTTLVPALAKRLGLPEAKVRAAFDAVKDAHHGRSRTALEARLDAAVKAHKITQADKESVLKAYDAGVLGRGKAAPSN